MDGQITEQQLLRFREYLQECDGPTLKELMSDPQGGGAIHHIAQLIVWCVNPSPEIDKFWKTRQEEAKNQQRELQAVINTFREAALAYQHLFTANHASVMLTPPPANIEELLRLPSTLQNEARRIEEQLHKIEPRRRMKRFGETSNIDLLRVKSFVRRWTGGLTLSNSELAYLLEAGQHAVRSPENVLGLPEKVLEIDPENLGDRLRRFTSNPENCYMCQAIDAEQKSYCETLRGLNPIETTF